MIARILIVVVFLVTFRSSLAQDQTEAGTLHVRVIDVDTNQPLPFSSVYLDQTTFGGYTNDQGEIDIPQIPFGEYTLMVSEISHLPHSRKVVIKDAETIRILAKLPVRVLNEVQVTAKRDKQWERQYERFERMFFGAEHFKDCRITNAGVLDFKVVNGDFIAEATEPLKIENNYLGYKLDLNLKNCVFRATSFTITGGVRYEEMRGDENLTIKWKQNRENTFHGSPQHFFSSVVNGTENREGYRIYTDLTGKEKIVRAPQLSSNININISPDSLNGKVKKINAALYSISAPSRLEVHYLGKRARVTVYSDVGHPISWLEVSKGPLIVNKQGIVQNASVLIVSGAMSELRVADWLPLNYQSSETRYSANQVAKPAIARNDLLEKPYVQTDRDYYYQTETIWLKGYMNYLVPMARDTMSQTVYVDLVDRYGKIVVAKKYRIESASFYGDIHLDRTLVPGQYQLRAYTAWMLNFDPKLIFTKTIALLQHNEAVKPPSAYIPPADTLPTISLQTDKPSYNAGEKIDITIDVTDSLNFRTASNLSVSVIDISQAVPVKNEKTIMNSFAFDNNLANATTPPRYNIEYGIGFNGKLLVGKKPTQGKITVYQDNSQETFDIVTDDAGKFRRNLLFNDTLTFYFKAVSAGNKKGIVVMDTLRLGVSSLPFDPFLLHIYSTGKNRNTGAMADAGATMLKEVSVTGKKIEKQRSATIHGTGDYVITGDWINDRNFIDVFFAIVANVPGSQYDPSGPTFRFISSQYSSFNNGAGAGAPLFLVDGVTMNESQIRTIPVRSIDRIDVLKYGATATYGTRGGNGVVLIYTKTGVSTAPQRNPLDKKKVEILRWPGYTSTLRFTASRYSGTIYWSPIVITDGQEPTVISFLAADDATRYRIVVEGVTVSGAPLHAEKIVEIVKGH
jgi:hypothetical protein